MAENEKHEFTVHPASVEFKNSRDYLTEISVGRVDASHPNRFERWEVVIRLPDPDALLATEEAQEYQEELKEKWGLDLATALRDYIGGKLATMPAYHALLPEDKVAPANFQEEAQRLADEYKVGSRASGTGGVKAKAQKFDALEKIKSDDALSEEEKLAKVRELLGL